MSTASGKRNPVYDQAKGIAIILVVAGHLITRESWLLKWIYSFHIPLFLFVNGCLQAGRRPVLSMKDYAWKEARSLLYPFLVFSLLKSVINFFLEHGNPREYIDPVVWLFLFAGDGALWYLPAFFLTALLFFWIRKRGILPGFLLPFLLTFVLSSLICAGKPFLPTMPMFYLNLVNRSLIMCTFTIAGYYFAGHFPAMRHPGILSIVLLGTGALLSQMNIQPDIHYSVLGNPLLFYLSATASCIGVLLLLQTLAAHGRSLRLLAWYGKNSLIIYLTHTTFRLTMLSRDLMKLWTGESLAVSLGAVILVMLIEIPVIWLMNGPLSFLIQLPRKRRISE